MSKLEKAYLTLLRLEQRNSAERPLIDPRASIIVSILYLCLMLSVPVGKLSMLIWFQVIPIICAAWQGIGFGKIFLHSLMILPLAACIGIFNPMIDRMPGLTIGEITISQGWLSFTSIILRGLMAMQMLLILIETCGFNGICRALRRIGIPTFLTDQMQFVYRYLTVLLREVLTMRRAREARGYGEKRYPVKIWGRMIGQLFLRSIARSERIGMAMQARNFTGTLPSYTTNEESPKFNSLVYLLIIAGLSIIFRCYDFSNLFSY